MTDSTFLAVPASLLDWPVPAVQIQISGLKDHGRFPPWYTRQGRVLPQLFGADQAKTLTARCLWRGTSLVHLDRVHATGIDVDPPTGPFFAGGFYKALEYGGWPKLVLALDRERLDPCWREVVLSDVSERDLDDFEKTFPTRLPSPDGSRAWFSKLPEGDRRLASAYEREYGFWIPGPSPAVLRAALVLERMEEPVAGR